MPNHSSYRDSDRNIRRRRYSSECDNDQPRKHQLARRQSFERDRHSNTEQRTKDDWRSDSHKKHSSRSPRDRKPRNRIREPPEPLSPEARHRSHRDNRGHSDRSPSASRSPPAKRRRPDPTETHRRSFDHRRSRKPRTRSQSPTGLSLPIKRSNAPLPSQEAAYKHDPNSDAVAKPVPEIEKQKPNYAPTGKLAAETNTVANTSIVLKYNEPPEARLPPASSQWRLYVFKGQEVLETLPLHERSCWLFGRERAVVDFPTEHPSCSKQHAVLQFRYTEKKNEWGESKGGVKPYVIDLESANGTKVNGEPIPERRYVEVRSADVITFGESTREYVILMPPKEDTKP
jgi:smad nuclear-interacting protein 1